MKKTIILLSLGVFLAVSCENIKPEPQVSKVSFTPCQQDKQQSKLKSSELSSNVNVEFTAEGIHITYRDFEVTCDFTEVNVTHTLVNGVLRITQKGTPNQAKCICYTDVSYTINGILQSEVNVIFINGVQVYCHNDENDCACIEKEIRKVIENELATIFVFTGIPILTVGVDSLAFVLEKNHKEFWHPCYGRVPLEYREEGLKVRISGNVTNCQVTRYAPNAKLLPAFIFELISIEKVEQ